MRTITVPDLTRAAFLRRLRLNGWDLWNTSVNVGGRWVGVRRHNGRIDYRGTLAACWLVAKGG